jgi:hypothetical protein
MPVTTRLALPKVTDPVIAATMLEQAQQALFNLITGTLPSGIDNPTLGRVTFNATNVADLQRLIDYLTGVVAGAGGSGAAGGYGGRVPISFFGWP